MSYDVTIGTFSGNMTSNASSVWRDHIPGAEGSEDTQRGGLLRLHGLTGSEALPILAEAFENLAYTRRSIGEPKMAAKYDTPNGWGSLIGAIIFIGQVMGACATNPDSVIHVWN